MSESEPVWNIDINVESDLVKVRKVGREASKLAGFGLADVTRIVTAASELARNVYRYAGSGSVICRHLKQGNVTGIELVFKDEGPGIADIELAMSKGFSTQKSMGMGLPGAEKLMDEMTIESQLGKGTTVTITKWKK